MPCRDYQDDNLYPSAASMQEIRELRRRNDQLMRVICSIDEHFGLTEKQMLSMRHGAEVVQVINKHRADDAAEAARQKKARERKRIEKELADKRAAAIATLTPAQKAALNLK